MQPFKLQNILVPDYLKEPLPRPRLSAYSLRSTPAINETNFNTDSYRNSFYPDAIRSWNNLDDGLRNLQSLPNFKNKMNAYLDHHRKVYLVFMIQCQLSGYLTTSWTLFH